ncbi:unnamed protein product [Trichobilharzia regenti]|nr:unnamed protein product [Trichobilharzia regenti]
MKGGTTSEALEDFTGGIAEMFDLKKDTRPDLLSLMLKSQELCSLMACSIQADPNQFEARLPNGLIMGHAYSVTSVKMVRRKSAFMSAVIIYLILFLYYSDWLKNFFSLHCLSG